MLSPVGKGPREGNTVFVLSYCRYYCPNNERTKLCPITRTKGERPYASNGFALGQTPTLVGHDYGLLDVAQHHDFIYESFRCQGDECPPANSCERERKNDSF